MSRAVKCEIRTAYVQKNPRRSEPTGEQAFKAAIKELIRQYGDYHTKCLPHYDNWNISNHENWKLRQKLLRQLLEI